MTAAAALLAAWLLPAPALAQAYDRIAPKVPAENAPAEVLPPPAPTPAVAANEVLLPALNGLVFVPDRTAIRTSGVAAGSAGPGGVSSSGVTLLSDPGFIERMRPFIGARLTRADLDRITQLVDTWYQQHDRPFVAVAVPPQNISSGVIQIVVTQYRIADVRAEGNHWFASDLLVKESGLVPGQTLTLSGVQDDLDRLNANPFRSVTTVFTPGALSGETNVVLATEDRLPLRVHGSYDNAGVSTLGRTEWSAGAVGGNLFGLDEQLAYQYTRATSGRFDAHSLSWTLPLPWHDKLVVFGSYEQERPDLGPDFGDPGHSGQASLRYVHPLPRIALASSVSLSQDVQIGYDFKSTNNALEFGGVQVFASDVEIDQFPVVYDLAQTDPYGQTNLTDQFVYSPGGISGDNDNAAFRNAVPHSSAGYFYDRLELTRITWLPARFSWVERIVGQLANVNLQYSEQLGAGGPTSVRGYYTDTAIGSNGVLASQEIRLPVVNLPGPAAAGGAVAARGAVADQLQFAVFQDWGHIQQSAAVDERVNHASLSSAGVAAHLVLGRYLDVRVDMGWQLIAPPGPGGRGSFADMALTVGF